MVGRPWRWDARRIDQVEPGSLLKPYRAYSRRTALIQAFLNIDRQYIQETRGTDASQRESSRRWPQPFFTHRAVKNAIRYEMLFYRALKS